MKNILLSSLFIICSIILVQAQSDMPDMKGQHPQWAINVFNIDSLNTEGDCDTRLSHSKYKGINTEADELAPVISGDGSVLYFVRVEIDTVVVLMDGTELIIDYLNDPSNYWYPEHVKYLYGKKDDWLQKKRVELESPVNIYDTVFIQQQDIWVTWRGGSETTGWEDWEIAQKLPYPINNEYQNVVCQTNDDGTQIFLSNQYIPNFVEDITDSTGLYTTYSMLPGISVTKYNGSISDGDFPQNGIWGEIQNIDIDGFYPNRDSHFFYQIAADSSYVIFSAHLNNRENFLEEDLYIAFNDKMPFNEKLEKLREQREVIANDTTDAPTTDAEEPTKFGFANIISLGETVNDKKGKNPKSRNNIITKTFRREYLSQHTFETAPFLSVDQRRLYFTRVERFLSTIREKDITDSDKFYSEVSLYEVDRVDSETLKKLWDNKVANDKKSNKYTVADSLEFVWSDPAVWGEPLKLYDEFQNHDAILHEADFEAYLTLHTDTDSNFEDYGFISMKVDSCMNADIYELDFIRGHLLRVETYALPSKTTDLDLAKKVKTEVVLEQNKTNANDVTEFEPTPKTKLDPLSNTLIAASGGGKGGSNVQWFEFFLDPNLKGHDRDNVLYVSLGNNTEIYNHNFEEVNIPEEEVKSFVSYMVDGVAEVVPDTTVEVYERVDDAEVLYVEYNKEMVYNHNTDPVKSTAEKTAWTIDTKTITDSLNYVDVMKIYVLRPEPEIIIPDLPSIDLNLTGGPTPVTQPGDSIVYVYLPCDCDEDDVVVPQEFKLKGVLFARMQWDLAYQYQVFLDQVAKVLNDNPDYIISLGGYTDSRGSIQDNEILSKRRVNSVQTYLMSKGIAPNRIYANFYGEASHLRDNQGNIDSNNAYALSRRVVIEQIANKSQFVVGQVSNTENKEITIIVDPGSGRIQQIIMPE